MKLTQVLLIGGLGLASQTIAMPSPHTTYEPAVHGENSVEAISAASNPFTDPESCDDDHNGNDKANGAYPTLNSIDAAAVSPANSTSDAFRDVTLTGVPSSRATGSTLQSAQNMNFKSDALSSLSSFHLIVLSTVVAGILIF